MLNHTNIDRLDSVAVSPAPFEYGCTQRIGNMTVPPGCILSLKVYVTEDNLMPYRFHSLRQDGRLMICDNRGNLVGYWQVFNTTEAIQLFPGDPAGPVDGLDYVSSFILDMEGVLMGHIACSVQLVDIIRGVLADTTETLFLEPNAFVLLPQCHVAMLKGYAKSIGIQSQNKTTEYHTGNLTITSADNSTENNVWIGGYTITGSTATETVEEYGDIPVNLTNTKAMTEDRAEYNGICSLCVNGNTIGDVSNHSIVVKASVKSNLRVITEDNKIVLRGVLNA